MWFLSIFAKMPKNPPSLIFVKIRHPTPFRVLVLADLSEKFSGQKNFLRGMLAGEFSHHKNIFFVCGEKIRPGIYVDDDFFIDAS